MMETAARRRPSINGTVHWQTLRMPRVDPLAAVEALAAAGLARQLWVYGGEEQVSVATGVMAQLTVTDRELQLDWGGQREHVE